MASSKEYALQIAIGGMVASSLKKAVAKANGELSGLQKAGSIAGKGFAAGFAASVATIGAVGKELYDIGNKFDKAYDNIRINTGATGEQLEALEGSMKNVYANVPASLEDTSQAIADYNTRLGVTGETLETLSTQALQASGMLGEDLGGMIESSSKAMQQWNIAEEDMADSMDYIFKVAQNTGTSMTELFGDMQSYGAQLQDMGYSFEEAAALIGQLDKAGVNTGEVLGAMKKSVTAMAKDGLSASEGLEQYVEQIKAAGTEAEATAIASEVFGTRAGSTMANAIRDGTLSVEDFTAALEANNETIGQAAWDTYSFPEQVEMMKHQLETAIQPAGTMLFSSLSEMMPTIMNMINGVLPIVLDTVNQILPVIQAIFSAVDFDMLGDVISQLVSALAPVITQIAGYLPRIMSFVSQVISIVAPFIGPLLDAIMPLVDAIMNLALQLLPVILPLLQPILELVMALMPAIQIVADLLTALTPVITWIVSGLQVLVGGVLSGITELIGSLINGLKSIIDFLINVFQGNWESVWNSIKDTFSLVWDGIKAACAGAVNAIIRLINGIINAINKIHIGPLPNWKILGEYAGAEIGFNIPNVPQVQLAEGGIATGPTNALIGEGGESEAVLPLSKLESLLGGGIGGGEVVITFAPVINCQNGNPEEIKGVMQDEFEKFKAYMERYNKENRRLQFSH